MPGRLEHGCVREDASVTRVRETANRGNRAGPAHSHEGREQKRVHVAVKIIKVFTLILVVLQ